MENNLTAKQLEVLIAKTAATLQSLSEAHEALLVADNLAFAKTIHHLEADPNAHLDASLVPVDRTEAWRLGNCRIPATVSRKVVQYFIRRELGGGGLAYHMSCLTGKPNLYAKSKSGNIYRHGTGPDGRETLILEGKGSKP